MAKWKEVPPTPSPEAIVRAALERAAEVAEGYDVEVREAISALTSDTAEVAAIIKKAGEDRG